MFEQWSLVMTEFQGQATQWQQLDEAVPRIFGRRGLDVFTLVCGRDVLPAELMASLSHQRALQTALNLESLGVKVEVVPTSQVKSVRHRAAEVWATHITDEFTFTEIDGMVFAAPALNARRNVAVLRRNHQDNWRDWQYERGMNHIHADASRIELPPRERVRAEVKLAGQYENVLRMVYPDKHFVLSHIVGDSVTFYQASPEAPTADIAPENKGWEKIWCEHCHQQQPYSLRVEPDAEFPAAHWGDCLVCGSEVLVASGEILRLITPAP